MNRRLASTAPIAVCLATLACTVSLGGPPIPPESAAPSPEGLTSFKDKWGALPETLTNGYFTLTFSDEEVASVINEALINGTTESNANIPLHNTHVALDGDIVLYAQSAGQLINATGMMTLHPVIGPDGQLDVQVTSAEFGRASFDEPVLDQLASTVESALTGPVTGLPVSMVLTGVSVIDGQLIITGNIIE